LTPASFKSFYTLLYSFFRLEKNYRYSSKYAESIILFFEAEFFIIICKKNRKLRDFSYLKVRSNFCWGLMDSRWGL